MTIQQLVENKSTLNYQKLCTALIQTFGVTETVNWESILPAYAKARPKANSKECNRPCSIRFVKN